VKRKRDPEDWGGLGREQHGSSLQFEERGKLVIKEKEKLAIFGAQSTVKKLSGKVMTGPALVVEKKRKQFPDTSFRSALYTTLSV
jgi:hypothetical protein